MEGSPRFQFTIQPAQLRVLLSLGLQAPAANPLNESGNVRSAEVLRFRFEHFAWPSGKHPR